MLYKARWRYGARIVRRYENASERASVRVQVRERLRGHLVGEDKVERADSVLYRRLVVAQP